MRQRPVLLNPTTSTTALYITGAAVAAGNVYAYVTTGSMPRWNLTLAPWLCWGAGLVVALLLIPLTRRRQRAHDEAQERREQQRQDAINAAESALRQSKAAHVARQKHLALQARSQDAANAGFAECMETRRQVLEARLEQRAARQQTAEESK